MMKAFSFLTILESLSKKLSILRTKMHSNNLRVDYESITSQLRVSRPFSHCASLGASFDLSRRASHFAAILTILFTIGVGSVWGDDYAETYNPPTTGAAGSAGMGAFSVIGSVTGNVSFGNSSLQIGTNNGSGTFVVASKDGSYISSIAFTNSSSYPINTLTSDQGTVTKDGDVYTFTPSSATLTSATFSMSAQSGKKVRVSPITINLTSNYEYFTKNFSVSSGTVSCTKSNASTDVTLTTTGGTSSNYLTVNSGKTLTITSSGHNIKSVHFVFQNHVSATYTASTGTYSSNAWTAGDDTQTVTFSSEASTAIVGISVELVEIGETHTVTAATDNASYGTAAAASTTVAEGGTTTITATPKTGYQFDHWTVSGTGATLSSTSTNPTTLTMGTSDVTVTAYFVEKTCPTSGTLYSLTAKSATYSVPATTETNMESDYAIVSGGGAYIGNKNSSAGKAQVTTTGNGTVYFNGADGYVKLVLDCPIQTGDQLTFENGSGSNQICFTTTNTRSTTYTTASNTYTFPAAFNDASTIYVWRTSGSSTYMHSLTITRPTPSTPEPETYSINYECDGATSGCPSNATEQTALPNPLPSAPTKTGYTFVGWYTDAAKTIPAVAGATLTANTTLYAQWNCTAPTNVAISGEYVHFPGETLTLTVSGDNIANNATYTWKKGGQVIAGQTTATLTINETTIENAGNYTCTISNGGSCEATANFTVKMYSLRGLIDWSTDCSFTKVNSTTATYSMELAGSSSYEFKIFDGSVYYGNEGADPTMTHSNCTNWTMQQDMGNNVTLQTTAAGTYTFTLDYSDASNLKISVTYPAKRIVYLEPGVWESNNPKFVVHAWYGSTVQDILMTKIDDCAGRNIYQAEIDANHEQVIFIRVNPAELNLSNPWNNEWNRTKDLTLISENQFTITNWGGTGEWNNSTEKSNGEWTTFTPNYTVTFDANGRGTAPEAQCVAKDAKATTPAAPTATGYTFGGWYKEAGCTNAWDFANGVVTSDITLYAKWTPNANTAYTVKHYKQQLDGTYSATPDETDNLTGTTAASVTPAVKSYTGFTAPSTQTVTIAADGSTVVEYQYTRNSYKVTWKPAGGNWNSDTNDKVVEHKYGAEIQAPEKPDRDNYEFVEWNPTYTAGSTMPANDVTYTAQWEEIAQTYTINYNLGPEKWATGYTPASTYTAGTEYTLPTIDNLTNENYGTFQGWYENNTFTGDAVTTIPADATGDKTYYAKWEYEIKFFEVVDEETDVVNKEFTNPLEGSYPTTYTYGKGITLPELPAKDGYTAAGWYSQWCVYYEETNGLGWVDACKSTALASDAYGNVNFAVKYTATDDATDCPSSGMLYTAVAAATENISIAGNTTDLELNVSTHKTTVTGGSMYVTSQQGEAKNLITSKGFAMTNNNTFFKISMDCELQEGDIISIEVGNDGANERGVWVSSATSRPNSQPECALTATNASLVPVTYTVTQSDEYNGKKVLYIYRATANSTYFNNINISRPVTCTTPTTAFANGSYTVGGSALDLSTLISSKQGSGAITYTVKNANGTGATIAGTSFTATSAGTATVTATQAADGDYCEKVMDATITVTATDEPEPDNCGISECGNATLTYTINASTSTANTADNLLSSATASNTAALGVNNKAVFSTITADGDGKAAAATNECFNPAPVMSSKIKMYKGSSYDTNTYLQFTFTVKSGYTFTPCDVQFIVQPVMTAANFRWVITNGTTEYGSGTANDVPVGQGNGATALLGLSSPSAMPAGTYYIRLYPYDNDDNSFRISNDVILKGTVEEVVCTTPAAPTAFAVGSITSNGATFTITDAANTNNYEIYYSTTSTAPTAGTEATITTTEKTKAVTGLTATTTYYAWVRAVCNAENKSSWVALTNNSFTTSAELTPGDCEDLVNTSAKTSTELNTTIGEATLSNPGTGSSSAIKLNSSGYIELSPKAGYSFEEGDKLFVTIYNQASGNKETGFKIGDQTFTAAINGKSNYTFEETLTAANIIDGKVKIMRHSSDGWFVSIIIQRCAALPSCTTPVLSNLENKKVCPGEDVSWTANNTAALQDGETIAYQWNKKGNNTVLSNRDILTLDNVTEATDGTYVVTATVSADGKASATATKEVTLTVTPATATPTITASASTVYAGNPVTLTATCASSGVTYQWYTCNADGTNPQIINDEENVTLALTPDKAGTYYYKVIVTGDGTYSCGPAEKVYTLVVSNSGETTCGEIKGQFTTGAYTFDTDFIIYGINSGGNLDEGASSSQGTICGGSGNYFGKQRFVVTFPVDVLSFSFIGYQSNLRTVEAVKTTTDLKTADTEYTTITHTAEVSQEGNCQTHVITPETAIPANTFVWVELSNGLNISEICYVPVSTADCNDPQVTATVDNATVCEGTENVTFTATNYANEAAFQWQKKDGNTWEEINGATSDTYTISSVTTAHAGKYRVIAEAGCKRISEEVTLTVLTAPTFNNFATTASVMKGNALAISDVQATDATGYAWYKSADNTFNAAEDTKVSTSKDLLLAAASITEAADQSFYLFCVASNSCGSVTSNAITVTVTPFVEEECATAGNEGDHEFGFTNTSCSEDTYGDSKTPVWKTNSRKKYLTYTAPEGRYFATAKVTVAHTGGTKCGYAYSTDGGTTWTFAELEGLSTTLTAITIELSELSENVNAFRISRNLTAQDGEKGSDSETFYLAEACFTYENACTETTLTVGLYDDKYNMSVQMGFVEPTFTLKSGETTLEGQTLTYTSSNTAIATVDEDGNVTFEGMTGTVTITATYAGGTIDEVDYCASQGSYTITVGCKDAAPKIFAADGTNLGGCNASITLLAKMEDGTAFADGTFQWYRDGEAIEGATSASYEVVRAGTYTVSRTDACIKMSLNSAVVTNENVEPQVERLTPFQYYHVDKTYSDQMKNRHLFAVTSYGTLNGKRYHLTATKNGAPLNLSSSNAFFTIPSSDNAVDTVMINLNELKEKYSANDEIVITCAPINSCNNASAITASITIHVIGDKPTLALICSGAEGEGTRETANLVVGGDFLTGYNKADLCQQTGAKTFDANTEWGFYTELKEKYIVTPVNGYAEFNKLNYEPFDILLLTDYPKASKSEAAATILDDMAALCDYRPLLSLKAHMVAKTPSKWAAKGFTTSPVVPATTSQYANIVCYAHPMFDNLDDAQKEGIYHDHDDFNQLVYQILKGPGHESSKGLQGFELKDADNFVTIGLIHYNAAAAVVTHDNHTHLEWTPAADDRQLVAIAERQANIEARMILFAINCGAQSMQTPMGRQVLLTCLDYLLKTDLIEVADCRLTFDNGEGNTNWDASTYEGTGTIGDGLWSTAANWGPEYKVVPGRNNDVRIAAPCTVDANEVEVLSVHITENGSLTIPADKSFTARSTILRADENGNVYPTNVEDISLGSNAGGNASLILNNERGDTKAGVAMYSKAKAGTGTTWQYIGTPHSDVQNATYNYYNSWIYSWNPSAGWEVVPTGGAVYPWVGYCITHPEQGHTYWMEGTLVETTTQEIEVPSNSYQIIGNSWTAPIQIANFEETDFEGIETKTIYFFNTGTDPEGSGDVTANATSDARWAAGTYISVPIHAADYTGEDTEIPSMQGFYVANNNPTTAGTLHLDYERHVRAPRKNTPSGPMHAPARRVAADNEPQVAKLLVRGKRYDDKLVLLEREDFTRGYDSGWDGDKWDGGPIPPTIWAVNEFGGADAVSAIPEYEGTVIGFRAGEDSEYTIHFDYDGMEDALYLLDTDTQIYTRVLKGNSYTFTCTDKAEHNRFILTRKAPQIATGTEHINTGENAKAVKFIKDDKIFIFVNGMLYDATGKIVIR